MISLWSIRDARLADGPDVKRSVESLLRELTGNENRQLENFDEVYRGILANRTHGNILVARNLEISEDGESTPTTEAQRLDATKPESERTELEPGEGEILGVMTYTVHTALRSGGPYAIIEELWVDPRARSQGVGRALFKVFWTTLSEDVASVEVGLPPVAFEGNERTKNFYENNGFILMGPRMRVRLKEPAGSGSFSTGTK